LSSSKYDKIGNYNLSYELLKEAVKEFDGYVLGLSQNDIWLFADDILSSAGFTRPEMAKVDDNLKKYLTEIMPRILDRTTGTFFFNNLCKSDNITNLKGYVKNYSSIEAKKMMTFVPGHYPPGQSVDQNIFIGGMRGYLPFEEEQKVNVKEDLSYNEARTRLDADRYEFSEIASGYEMNEETGLYTYYQTEDKFGASKLYTMNSCLGYYDVNGIIKSNVTKQVKDEKTGEIKNETQYLDEDKKEPKMFSSDVSVDSSKINTPEINKSLDGIPDRFISPSLGALVVQHPKASNAAKGKDHLPIFFNAIPAIEMSRCVPYIDVRVLSENYKIDSNGDKTAPNSLNSVAYMRFIKKDKNGYFSLDDSVGFGNLNPVSKSVKLDESEALKNIDVSYMDIFTTPQTFSNANINNSNSSDKYLDQLNNINSDPILEPIMPFLSLESVNISITGAGYGIMSSKKGSLKLTLHDRSRLKDLAPLVSSSQFATTRILIEYGWNHPEGGPGSDNIIGKYLNALKDRSVYQVVKCDYDFSDGGAVGINIGLAAYGFRQTERVHCGAGPEIPLNVFSEYFESVSEDLIRNNQLKNGKNKEKAKEVRQKIKLNDRAARSTNNSLSWGAYREIMGELRKGGKGTTKSLQYIFELETITDSEEKIKRKDQILDELIDEFFDTGDDTGILTFQRLENAGLFQENTKEAMLQRLYGKIKAFDDPRIPDPFINSLVYGSAALTEVLSVAGLENNTSEQQKDSACHGAMASENFSKYVTLGKAISNLVAFPLAATCLYDEVQIIFYPLNHHSGGGRIHTTASFPIPIKRIREEVQDAVKTSSNISIKRMFSILERIVKDRNLPAYGIADVFTNGDGDNFNDLDENDQLEIVLENCCGSESEYKLTFDTNDDTDKSIKGHYDSNIKNQSYPNSKSLKEGAFSTKNGGLLRKRLNQLLLEYKKGRNQKIVKDLSDRLKDIYKDDGLANEFPGLDKFVRPNITMDFEVVDAIRALDAGEEPGYGARLINQIIPGKNTDNGLYENKSILRVHIYDEETVMSPAEHTLLSTMTEGVTGKPITGTNSKESIIEISKKLNFNQAKQYIKRTYPTIIYGSAGSTVRNLSISANTSGQMANILMVESYGNLKQAQVGGINSETSFESVTMFPNTVSCTLMGMPMIGRGNTIFIDFGTNTSLDNIYTVKNVTHTIRAGDFSTTLELVPSNMGAVQGFAKNIAKMISE
tara:strand:- start:1803 stop:5456 length:3654 start_codon:yes stop_codon:yes gene_type:complete